VQWWDILIRQWQKRGNGQPCELPMLNVRHGVKLEGEREIEREGREGI